MSTLVKAKSRGAKPDLSRVPAPVTTADRVVLEIRKFIAAAIFFNTQAAEKAGLGLTDMQMLHKLQLYGPSTQLQHVQHLHVSQAEAGLFRGLRSEEHTSELQSRQ